MRIYRYYVVEITNRLTETLQKKITVRFNIVKNIGQLSNKDLPPKLYTKGIYKPNEIVGKVTLDIQGETSSAKLGNRNANTWSSVAEHLHQHGDHYINYEDVEVLATTMQYH